MKDMPYPFESIPQEYLSDYLRDFPTLAVELFKYRVISKDLLDSFLSLDLEHLKPGDIALRYLLQQMLCEKRKEVQEVILRVERVRNRLVGNSKYICDSIINELKGPKVCSEPSAEELLCLSEVSYWAEELVEGSDKWEEIGIALGLPRYKRKDCGEGNSNIVKLTNVLEAWILGRYTGSRSATLGNLKLALCSETVGLRRLATKLRKRYFSSQKELKVDTELQVDYQPADTKVVLKKSTLLEVQVISNKRECYQWNKDGVGLLDGAGFSGVSTNILFVNEMTKEKEGKYFCRCKYRCGQPRYCWRRKS